MPPRRRISLAAALFGFPAAPGRSTPQLQAPDSWLELFTSEHADAGVFLGIFTSCRAGRDWALATAPQLNVTLDYTAAPSLAGWMRQLGAVQAYVRTRSAQPDLAPASLTVIRDETANSNTAVAMLLGALHQAGPGQQGGGAFSLTSRSQPSRYDRPSYEDEEAPSNLLEAIALAFPTLASLTVHNCNAPIPPHPQLPHLTHIHLTTRFSHIHTISRSIAPFITQLRSLHLDCNLRDREIDTYQFPEEEDTDHIPWLLVFKPDQIAENLTTLNTNTLLDDWFVNLILDHAPSLVDLGVHGIDLDEDWAVGDEGDGDVEGEGRGEGEVWVVRRLRFDEETFKVDAECLARLPKTREGHLLVEGEGVSVVFTVTGDEASDLRLAERMPGWQLKFQTIELRGKAAPSDPDDPPGTNTNPDQAEAQCRMLRMLSLLVQPSSGTVELTDMHFSLRPLQLLAELLPSLGELDFRVSFGTPLTDELLGVVVGMGSRVRTLTCPSLALHSKRDARTPWQWERLTCETLDLGQLHRLPEPRRGQTCVVCVEELVVGEDTAQATRHLDDICLRLRETYFVSPSPIYISTPITITVKCRQPDAPLHKSQLAMLRKLDIVYDATRVLALVGFSMTQKGVRGLSVLPKWEDAVLDLSQCGPWPLTAAQYAQELSQSVPKGFGKWRFPKTKMHGKLEGLMEQGGNGVRRGIEVELV